MALNIVRHDITKIKADAIVNSTNEHLAVGGLGVDASIHYAAGLKLEEALKEIGFCPVGSSVITDSFGIPTCRYIIHAVPPVYTGKDPEEQTLLSRTYWSILSTASRKKCRTVAVPLLSAGANGYPKEEAYRLATGAMRGWLAQHYASEMDIILVLYNQDVVDLGRLIDHDLQDYITDYYTEDQKEALREHYQLSSRNRRFEYAETQMMEAAPAVLADSLNTHCSIDRYADVDLSFAEMCEWWCEKKGIKKGQFYADSNISKATFSYMKLHPDIVPKTYNAFACAVGLKLNIDQAKDLLMRAGLTFSKMFPFDRVVEQCIRDGMLDIDRINLKLFEMDLPLLGQKMKDRE